MIREIQIEIFDFLNFHKSTEKWRRLAPGIWKNYNRVICVKSDIVYKNYFGALSILKKRILRSHPKITYEWQSAT